MAALVKKAGVELQTGATDSGISGTYTQTSGREAAGELKIYRDEDGEDISAYVADPHKELTFEAVLASTVADEEIGNPITINGHTFLVTQWRVTESNDDVKKVSIGARSTDITASSGGGSNP